MTVQEIKELISAFSDSEAVEMDLKQSDVALVLRKASAVMPKQQVSETPQSIVQNDAVAQEPEQTSAEAVVTAPAKPEAQNLTQVKAPLAGIFYRSSSPEAAPYVMVGQEVKKGDTIGLIEAMKVMNEIPAPCDGVIENILTDNEAFVGFEDVLMELA